MNYATAFAAAAITPQGRAFARALADGNEKNAQKAFIAMSNLLPARAAGTMPFETAAERKAAGAVYLEVFGNERAEESHTFDGCALDARKCLNLLAVAAGVELPQDCHKCNGAGYLQQYHYNAGGVCFACNGTGVATK